MKKQQKILISIISIILVLFIISILIAIFAKTPFLNSLRIVYGSIYVLFLPGFIISYIFFPKSKPFEDNEKNEEVHPETKGAIDSLERIALSFALSIAIVPLVVFYLNLIGLKINTLNTFLTILAIILVSSGILYWRIRKKK